MSNEMKKDSSFPDEQPDERTTDASDDTDAAADLGASEVAMRINLLGKLIIPPSVPR